MPESPLPKYLDRGGEQALRAPFLGRDVRLHGFMFDADEAALQAVCDRYLNAPSNGRVRYVPLVPRVLLIFAEFGRLGSQDSPDSQKGIMTEIDVAFWMPVAAVDPAGVAQKPKHLSWFIPYIFVDNPLAIASGREVYGYPKEQGTFVIPESRADPSLFAVDTNVCALFGPEAPQEHRRLFEVRRTDHIGGGIVGKAWGDLKDAFQDSMRLFVGNDGKASLSSVELLVDVFEYLVHDEVPTVFLKQFRDAADPSLACYQALIEAPSRVLKFRSANLVLGDYELTVFPFQSHPIVADLGLGGPKVQALAAWQADFDFVLGKGRAI